MYVNVRIYGSHCCNFSSQRAEILLHVKTYLNQDLTMYVCQLFFGKGGICPLKLPVRSECLKKHSPFHSQDLNVSLLPIQFVMIIHLASVAVSCNFIMSRA